MNQDETERLIQQAFDGELHPSLEAELAELAELLSSSEEARSIYCDYALLVTDLSQHATHALKTPGTIPARAAYASTTQKRRQITTSLLAAAACLMLGGLLLTMVFIDRGNSAVKLSQSPGTIITTSTGAFTETAIPRGEPLSIQQGVVRLEFSSGIIGIVEGPATLTLRDDSEIHLESGRAHFTVPPSGKGFTVTNKFLNVIDLGTDFGVDFREPQISGVQVFVGRVRVESRFGRKESLELTAGQSVRLGPVGNFIKHPDLGEAFATSLPASLPDLRIDFDRIEGSTIPITGTLADGSSAEITSPGKIEDAVKLVPGVVGSALEFTGDAELRTTWPGIHGDAPRTISLWCRIPVDGQLQNAPPLALWGYHYGMLNRKFKLAAVTLEDGMSYPQVSFGAYHLSGKIPINDGTWHHLAVVYRGNQADGSPDCTIFVDGQADGIGKLTDDGEIPRTDTLDDDSIPLVIGRYEINYSGGHPLYFRGAIDELRIISGALSREEIAEMAERPH